MDLGKSAGASSPIRDWATRYTHDDHAGESEPHHHQHHQHQEEEGDGVLLYYKYVDLGSDRRAVVKDWYRHQCGVEGLRGRVRVALNGVNCTLGASLAALRRHIGSVKAHSVLRGEDIDFKLSASRGARNSQAAQESGFTALSVKAVKEVVSLGDRGAGLSHRQGGRHVSPQEFHRLLRAQEEIAARRQPRGGERNRDRVDTDAGAGGPGPKKTLARESNGSATAAVDDDNDGERKLSSQVEQRRQSASHEAAAPGGESPVAAEDDKEAVLLDVRNVYETSIGHFSAEGVERLDPKTRQFSDLPKWVDENANHLRGKRVLMYCTGGVRCELASALIRQQCDADATGTEVLQLSGGIERYLQAYPQSGGGSSVRAEARAPRAAADLDGAEEGPEGDAGGGRSGSDGETSRCSGALGGGTGGGHGFFRGKNFVFDERVSVPEFPAGGIAIGRCLLCQCPWDDYGSRSRCSRCRMLVLVCDGCIARAATRVAPHRQPISSAPSLPMVLGPPRTGDTTIGDCCPVEGLGSRIPQPSPTAMPPPAVSPSSLSRLREASPAAAATAAIMRPHIRSTRDETKDEAVGESAELVLKAATANGTERVRSGGETEYSALLCSGCDLKRRQDARAPWPPGKGGS
ncbi:unnamed protein product [Scytosiphon promiscuus]